MGKHDAHLLTLLDSFIETTRFDLEFSDAELVRAILRYHERYSQKYGADDDVKTNEWRQKTISILKSAADDLEKNDRETWKHSDL